MQLRFNWLGRTKTPTWAGRATLRENMVSFYSYFSFYRRVKQLAGTETERRKAQFRSGQVRRSVSRFRLWPKKRVKGGRKKRGGTRDTRDWLGISGSVILPNNPCLFFNSFGYQWVSWSIIFFTTNTIPLYPLNKIYHSKLTRAGLLMSLFSY